VSARYGPSARLIWSLTNSGLGTAIAGSGNSGGWAGAGPGNGLPAQDAETPIDLRDVNDLALMVAVAAIVSAPSMKVGLDLYDDLGNLFPNVLQTAAITGAGNVVPILAGGAHGGSTGYLILPSWGRVNWTMSGGSMTGVEISLWAR
jgi:hypothetical protein